MVGSQSGDRCHPGNLIVTVCVGDCICRIRRIQIRPAHPANCRVGVTFPDAASINHVSDWGLRRDAVQVSSQVTITMAGYKSIPYQSESGCLSHSLKALTDNVSNAVAKIAGSSQIVLVVRSNCLLKSASRPGEP